MKKLIKKFFDEITFFGGVFFYIFIIGLLYFLSNQNSAYKMALSFIAVYIGTFIIRLFYFKPRPAIEEHNNFIEKIDASSFPSVHSARAILLTLFFMLQSNNLLSYLLLISICFLVIYSRIYLKKHDLIDIIGGLILGISIFTIIFIVL